MFYEHPRRGWALISWVVYVTCAASAYGAGAGFLLGVVGNITAQEVFGPEFAQPDKLQRLGIPVSALAIVAFIGVAVVFRDVSRFAYVRQLAAASQGAETRNRIPGPRAQTIRKSTPFLGVYIFGAYFLFFAAGALILFSLSLQETFTHNPDSARDGMVVVMTLAVLCVVVLALMLAAWRLLTPLWNDARARWGAVWTPELTLTAGKQSRNRLPEGVGLPSGLSPLWRVTSIALGVSGVLFMVGVFTRQPGKFADSRSYAEPGETLIAALVGLSGVIAVAASIAFVLLSIGGLLKHVSVLARLRAIAEGRRVSVPESGRGYRKNARKVAAQRYEDLLDRPWPSQSVGAVLVALGWGNVPLVFYTEQAFPGIWASWLLPIQAIVGTAGVVLLAWSDGSGARYRNVLRAAWG